MTELQCTSSFNQLQLIFVRLVWMLCCMKVAQPGSDAARTKVAEVRRRPSACNSAWGLLPRCMMWARGLEMQSDMQIAWYDEGREPRTTVTTVEAAARNRNNFIVVTAIRSLMSVMYKKQRLLKRKKSLVTVFAWNVPLTGSSFF